nr:hypothetical protein [Candidatus Enterousia merdequi]
MTEIQKAIQKTIKNSKKRDKTNTRYLSWKHCYDFFQQNHDQIEGSKEKMELAELHLGFYLASWGMYRGSSFLLNYDYTIHKNAIKTLCCSKLWKPRLDNEEGFEKYFNDLIKKLNKAYIKYYSEYIKNKNLKTDSTLTNTLVTKIILGTIGITPAYDRFFKQGVDELNNKLKPCIDGETIKFSKTVSAEEIIKWWKFYKQYQSSLKKYNHGYPPMKQIDRFVFELGNKKKKYDTR